MGSKTYSNIKKSSPLSVDSNFIGPLPFNMNDYDQFDVVHIDSTGNSFDADPNKIYSVDDILREFYSYTTTGKKNKVEKQYSYPVKKEDQDKLSILNEDDLVTEYLSQFEEVDFDNAYEQKQALQYYHEFYTFIEKNKINLDPKVSERLMRIEGKYQYISLNYPTQQESNELVKQYLDSEKQKKVEELMYLWICVNNPEIRSKIVEANTASYYGTSTQNILNMEDIWKMSGYGNNEDFSSILQFNQYNQSATSIMYDLQGFQQVQDGYNMFNDPVWKYLNYENVPFDVSLMINQKLKELYPDFQENTNFFSPAATTSFTMPENIKSILEKSNIPIEYIEAYKENNDSEKNTRAKVEDLLDTAYLSGAITADEKQDILIYTDQLKNGFFDNNVPQRDHDVYEIKDTDYISIHLNPEEFLATHDIYGMDLTQFKLSDLENRIDSLLDELSVNDYYIYQMNENSKQAPYLDLAQTQKYKKFISDNQSIKENSLLVFDLLSNAKNDVKDNYYKKLEDEGAEAAFDYLEKNVLLSYNATEELPRDTKYMTSEQQEMVFYLLETDGYDAALEYRELISDSINQAKGAEEAYKFIDSLSTMDEGEIKKTVGNFFKVSGQGLEDGLETYCNGIEEAFRNNASLTPDDYKVSIIMSYLSEHSNYYDEVYEFSSSMGNMLPTIAISATGTLVGCPELGVMFKGVASTGMFVSTFGNAKHQALVQGYDTFSSTVYALFNSASEVGMESLLGTIPGIGNVSESFVKDIFKEGFEELVQSFVDTGFRAVILGEEIDFTNMGKDGLKSFEYGMLMALCFNGGSRAINFTYGKVTGKIDATSFINNLSNNPDLPLEQVLEMSSINEEVYESPITAKLDNTAPTAKLNSETDYGSEPTAKLITADYEEATQKNLIVDPENDALKDYVPTSKINYSVEENISPPLEIDSNNIDSSDIFAYERQEITNMEGVINQLFNDYNELLDNCNYNQEIINRYKSGDYSNLSAADLVNLAKLTNYESEINSYTDLYNSKANQLSIMENMKTNYTNANETIKLDTKLDAAMYFLDAQQYLYLRLRSIYTNTSNASFKNEFDSIHYDPRTASIPGMEGKRASQNYSVDEMMKIMNKYNLWTDEDLAVLNMANKFSTNNNLTQAEKDAIHIFTSWGGPQLAAFNRKAMTVFNNTIIDGNNLSDINSYFDTCSDIFGKIYNRLFPVQVEKFNSIMDNLIAQNTIKNDMIVHRGCDGLFLNGEMLSIADMKPGTRFNDQAHTSTSVCSTHISKSSSILLEIEVPAGTHAAYIESNTGVSAYNQQELILGRNTQYEITGYPVYNPTTGQYTIPVRVIPTT